MKKILFLLAVIGWAAAGCQSSSGDNTPNALSNQPVAPVGPAGGGTKGVQ